MFIVESRNYFWCSMILIKKMHSQKTFYYQPKSHITVKKKKEQLRLIQFQDKFCILETLESACLNMQILAQSMNVIYDFCMWQSLV